MINYIFYFIRYEHDDRHTLHSVMNNDNVYSLLGPQETDLL